MMENDGGDVQRQGRVSVSGQSVVHPAAVESMLATSRQIKTRLLVTWLSFRTLVESRSPETGAYACPKLMAKQLIRPS